MTEHRGDFELPNINTPDALYFQQASMLMLAFRFKGTRKLVASRLLERDDFVAELVAHLPVLDQVYADWDVNAVEIVSFQRGAFYYDEWPDAMKIVRAHRAALGVAERDDGEGEALPDDADDADDHVADTDAA